MGVALRGGDRFLIEMAARAFTLLGATGAQGRIPFPTQTISAEEALALVGGLSTITVDPKGIFVFRDETEEVSNRATHRADLKGNPWLVYVLDLTKPNGIFTARKFLIRDQDTVCVSEAPVTKWNTAIFTLTGSLRIVN